MVVIPQTFIYFAQYIYVSIQYHKLTIRVGDIPSIGGVFFVVVFLLIWCCWLVDVFYFNFIKAKHTNTKHIFVI